MQILLNYVRILFLCFRNSYLENNFLIDRTFATYNVDQWKRSEYENKEQDGRS